MEQQVVQIQVLQSNGSISNLNKDSTGV